MFNKEDYNNMIFALNVVIIKQRSIVRDAKSKNNHVLHQMLPHFEEKLESLETTKAMVVSEKERLFR